MKEIGRRIENMDKVNSRIQMGYLLNSNFTKMNSKEKQK